MLDSIMSVSGTCVFRSSMSYRGGGRRDGGGRGPRRERIKETDRNTCPFFAKTGACRHGDRCERVHIQPKAGECDTLVLRHLYTLPEVVARSQGIVFTAEQRMAHLCQHFEDVFLELHKYGPVDAIHFAENQGVHMIGNIYIRFCEPMDCMRARQGILGLSICSLVSPPPLLTPRCNQFNTGSCSKGDQCNYLHVRYPDPVFAIKLFEYNHKYWSQKRGRVYRWKAEKYFENCGAFDQLLKELKEKEERGETTQEAPKAAPTAPERPAPAAPPRSKPSAPASRFGVESDRFARD
ncbi:U2 auxiliary factor small subunit [Kipferlia bialata]|uniref:U2 auxiliary factor small subunit n=1 Tax=Kipferlia bialata TaxID=797122 RepID=A0A9K3GGH8_9EUKA|nr:U2 auxiliary factor small subunit [Kipferlia bialata]|eukprot:g2236.t1